MAKSREDLHKILCNILGSRNCYYRPPTNLRIKYPCIIYDLDKSLIKRADNRSYIKARVWKITLIDQDPDSKFFDRLEDLTYCSFDRAYTLDNLNHFVFTLYY